MEHLFNKIYNFTQHVDISNILSTIAIFIAGCAAFFSWKQLKLQKIQLDKLKPAISVYMRNNIRENYPKTVSFIHEISLLNQANQNNTVVSIDLKIIYLTRDNLPANLIFPLIDNEGNSTNFKLPIAINANTSINGTATFSIKTDQLDKLKNCKYELIIKDIHHNITYYEIFKYMEQIGNDL